MFYRECIVDILHRVYLKLATFWNIFCSLWCVRTPELNPCLPQKGGWCMPLPFWNLANMRYGMEVGRQPLKRLVPDILGHFTGHSIRAFSLGNFFRAFPVGQSYRSRIVIIQKIISSLLNNDYPCHVNFLLCNFKLHILGWPVKCPNICESWKKT